jgi:hypothetical protein
MDDFTVEYRGELLVPTTGTYEFATASDDGSALWIDPGTDNPSYSNAVVQNDCAQDTTLRTGSIALVAGYHDFIVRYNQGGGGMAFEVYWAPPGGSGLVDIPATQFFTAVPEPSAIVLLGIGAISMLAYARRRRAKAS